MALTQSKAPNPNISDKNDPLYTSLNAHNKRWVTAGLIGDALALIGRGFDHYIANDNLQEVPNIAIGDFAMIGNRNGIVTDFKLNGDGQISSITVRQDMQYLPLIDRENPEVQGYDEDGYGKTETFVVDPNASEAGIRNAGGKGVVLNVGHILIIKARTADPATWPAEARASIAFQSQGQNILYPFPGSSLTADHCDLEEPALDRVIFTEKQDLEELETGDKVWLNAIRTQAHPNGIYYLGNETYVNIVDGLVAALPACV